jgi:hypothetical protein
VPSLPVEEQNKIVIGDVFGRLDATASLPQLSEACEEWRPAVVVRVLEEEPYRSAAERVAAELRSHPPADDVVDALEWLAAG